MLRFEIDFDDEDMLKEFIKQKNQVLTVGFFDETYPDGTRIGKIATIQEYGAPEKNIPPRPFMSTTVMKNRVKWQGILQDIIPQEMDVKRCLNILGDVVSNDVSEEIDAWEIPANAPATIEKKGFNDPLVDTGLMRDSVGWKVGRE